MEKKHECSVCGSTTKPLALRTFHVAYYIFEKEPICEECWAIDSDEWKEDLPWAAEMLPPPQQQNS